MEEYTFSASTLYQFNAPVDGGGKLNIARYNAALDMSSRVSRDLRLGLSLAYEYDDYDFSGLTNFPVAYRSHRFRLKEDGPIPNGIGEYKTVPVFARISHKFTPKIRIDVYGGATFVNKIYIEDQDGNELFSTKADIAPLIGLTFVASF